MTWKKKLAGVLLLHLPFGVLILLSSLTQPAQSKFVFQTRYAVVIAENEADFLEMERRLHFSSSGPTQPHRVTGEFSFHPAFPRLAAKIDAILLRTSHLLTLRPPGQSRLQINLVENGKKVQKLHRALMAGQRQGMFGFGSLEAFYEVSSRTIYLSLKDLHEGILAHEMAHYLLCAISPQPPSAVQEAWAQYVEANL